MNREFWCGYVLEMTENEIQIPHLPDMKPGCQSDDTSVQICDCEADAGCV
jgi:hypothetical protein